MTSARRSPEEENFFGQGKEAEIEFSQNWHAFTELIEQANRSLQSDSVDQATRVIEEAQKLLPSFTGADWESASKQIADLESRMPAI